MASIYIPLAECSWSSFLALVDLVSLYECLADRTRLRLLHLLQRGPLCVCHLQAALDEPQVKVSKHLGTLKRHGLLAVSRSGNWRIYELAAPLPPVVSTNLVCLAAAAAEDPQLATDLARLETLRAELADGADGCCPAPALAPLSSHEKR